jgi:hypothetical protein
MCYGLDKKCGNNIQRRSTFENTILTILTKVVDEAIQNGLFKLHKKLSINSTIPRKVNSCFIIFFQKHFEFFLKNQAKNKFDGAKCSFISHL